MGVYIKGFDFPKACWFCDFCRAYNEPNHGYFCCALDADLDKTTEIIQTERDKHCPLVEVKPHGRLIDADAFEKDCRKRFCHECDNYNGVKCHACWVDDMLGEVFDAPTIIESEEEDGVN